MNYSARLNRLEGSSGGAMMSTGSSTRASEGCEALGMHLIRLYRLAAQLLHTAYLKRIEWTSTRTQHINGVRGERTMRDFQYRIVYRNASCLEEISISYSIIPDVTELNLTEERKGMKNE